MASDAGEELPMTDITDPRDTDVLCGRGGAALRHPGNQTYRRLVNLNKGLYITCLKTEKLKISRSIVSAIREQNGRFLERDTAKGTWFDIGDKKAVEKTSQALREGQPKLRQKMVEMGGAPPGGMSMDQFGNNGIYNTGPAMATGVPAGFDPTGGYGMPQVPQGTHLPAPQHAMNAQHMGGHQSEMPPPPARHDMHPDMLQRLSLTSEEASRTSLRSRLRPSLETRGSRVAHELGMVESNLSLMSEFSSYAGSGINESAMSIGGDRPLGLDYFPHPGQGHSHPPGHDVQQQPPPPPMADASPSVRSFDRRRFFAKMKYSRQPSGRMNQHSQRSVGDGMPDIHLVDSNLSLFSNMSSVGTDSKPSANGHPGMSAESLRMLKEQLPSDYIGVGSRRSLMSGLSRISDNSEVNSIFSDLSKKIGNVSTRSIAMSEISGIEEAHYEDLEESFNIDPLPPSQATSTPMDFDV